MQKSFEQKWPEDVAYHELVVAGTINWHGVAKDRVD